VAGSRRPAFVVRQGCSAGVVRSRRLATPSVGRRGPPAAGRRPAGGSGRVAVTRSRPG